MSNKTHLRHSKWLQQQQQRRNRITALLLVLLFVVLLVVAVAMVSTGHGVPPGVR
jgi:cell division protein FtsL